MCSVSISRSAPATGMPSFFSARMIDSNSAPRRRTRTSTSLASRPCASPLRDVLGDALGELDHAAGAALGVERRIPGLDVLALVGLGRVPDLDQARRRLRQRLVDRRLGSADNPACAAGGRNTVSTAPSTFSPERNECLNSVETNGVRRCSCSASKCGAHRREFAGRRALEREDRLLLVADREDGAAAVVGAFAGEEFADQRLRSPTAWGWCPAPRRSAHDRCRDRACNAPRRPTTLLSSSSVLSIRSS